MVKIAREIFMKDVTIEKNKIRQEQKPVGEVE